MVLGTYIRKRLAEPLLAFLRQGLSPEKLALSICLGFALGIIPVWGVTTALCALAALAFRLNMAVIQLVNYFVYPLQILLFIPFIKAGEWVAGANPFPFSFPQLISMIRSDWWDTIQMIWKANLLGIMAWLILMIPVCLSLYQVLLVLFRRLERRNSRVKDHS